MEYGPIGTLQDSLAGTGSQYTVIQLRTNSAGLRIQGVSHGDNWEIDMPVSADLRVWVSARDHTRKSFASSTKYVPAMMRREDGTTDKVRILIDGPKHNRDWGVCFLLTSTILYNHAGGV